MPNCTPGVWLAGKKVGGVCEGHCVSCHHIHIFVVLLVVTLGTFCAVGDCVPSTFCYLCVCVCVWEMDLPHNENKSVLLVRE
jgi:hypothetical protein